MESDDKMGLLFPRDLFLGSVRKHYFNYNDAEWCVFGDVSSKGWSAGSIPKPDRALSLEELEIAIKCIVRHEQEIYFDNQFKNLSQCDLLSKKDSLASLDIVWDTHDQLVSVRGRLNIIEILPSYTRRPMLVSNLSHFAVLHIEHDHARLAHSGPATILASLPKPSPQKMGDLTLARVDVDPQFAPTGIDYAGPINVYTSKRKTNQEKSYICASRTCKIIEGIAWKFIRARAPHRRGAWETMVKNILRRQLGNAIMTVKQLNTALIEIEAVLNSHPLAPLSPDDFEDAINPSKLITGFNITSLPDPFVDSRYSPSSRLRKLTDEDLVVVVDEIQGCHEWSHGRIINVYPGSGGLIRTTEVKHSNGKVYQRPTIKLALVLLSENI
ncbi:unnamed protein product [Lepeophtheirus salmonis]|uniref:(salmon louse) hypothetical protein n=1 Tax=Lepeophtheirus salmonis TaxID=72036 RepID=A0A7R8CLD0_LEPSM|nr:unnamed protein product [Lepeophtheirus salmonis]CAF2822422.1 unnamed protein product [Lepeophtheirus salmonis]